MPDTIRLKDLLDFLIRREESSAELFLVMAEKTFDDSLKEWFRELHLGTIRRAKALVAFKTAGERCLLKQVPLASVKHYLVDVRLKDDFTEKQALALSILRADTSRLLYVRMQCFVEGPDARALFGHLEKEIEAHRIRCNFLYDRTLEGELF